MRLKIADLLPTATPRTLGKLVSQRVSTTSEGPQPEGKYVPPASQTSLHYGSRQPMVWVVLAFAAGITADRLLTIPISLGWSTAIVAWCLWWMVWRQQRAWTSGALLFAAVLASGAIAHHQHWRQFSADEVGRFAHESRSPVCLEAIAVEQPRRVPAPRHNPLRAIPRGDQSRLLVDVIRVRDGRLWKQATGRSELYVDGHLLGVRAGDRLRIYAQLSSPLPELNPGQFDYAQHLRADRVLSFLSANYPDCVSVLEKGSRWQPTNWIDRVRARSEQILWRSLNHQQSGMASALLLGMRRQITAEQTEPFMETGAMHLLAISGLHVGIVASVMLLVLRLGWISRRRGLIGVAILTIAYALLADAQPPVVRATVLVCVSCFTALIWRRGLALGPLALAAMVVLWNNPADLFRTGPQLSFIAAAALIWFFGRKKVGSPVDPLKRLIDQSRSLPDRAARRTVSWAWELTLLGCVVWAITLPLVAARFHIVATIAPLLNTVLWLPVASALISGFGVLICGWLWTPLAVVPAAVCDNSLWFLESGVALAATIPGGHLWVTGPSDWWLAGFYGLLAVWLFVPRWQLSPRWTIATLALWIAVGLGAGPAWASVQSSSPNHTPELRCTFTSVGHGCAVVVELPGGQTLLYDCGQLGSPSSGARTIASYLWEQGITHLDAVVISHADVDHYNALPELLERFSVGVVYVSHVMFQEKYGAVEALDIALAEANIPVVNIEGGERLATDDGSLLQVLHPPRKGVLGSDNANSIVLAIEYQGKRVLLTGDLETPGMEDVTAEEPWDTDILLAPHHGSPRSDPPRFAQWSRPEWVVISGGRNVDFAGAGKVYAEQGASVLHTAIGGAVRCVLSKDGIVVTTFRETQP